MVHGLWKNKPMELNAASGICTSGMNALKYAYMTIATGGARLAVCTGSERVSSWLRADKFNTESERLAALEQHPIIAFEKDFLRWMLSDRSEEHTSELQSRENLVCRLLLEKKKT